MTYQPKIHLHLHLNKEIINFGIMRGSTNLSLSGLSSLSLAARTSSAAMTIYDKIVGSVSNQNTKDAKKILIQHKSRSALTW